MRLPDDSPSATVWAAARRGELFCLLCTLTASDCAALNGAAKVLAWGELVEGSFPRPIGRGQAARAVLGSGSPATVPKRTLSSLAQR